MQNVGINVKALKGRDQAKFTREDRARELNSRPLLTTNANSQFKTAWPIIWPILRRKKVGKAKEFRLFCKSAYSALLWRLPFSFPWFKKLISVTDAQKLAARMYFSSSSLASACQSIMF